MSDIHSSCFWLAYGPLRRKGVWRGFPAPQAGHPLWGRGILALRQGTASPASLIYEWMSAFSILTRIKYVYILCFMEKKTSSIAKPVLEEIERDCLCLQVRKTARMVTQWYDACLQPSGLRSTQFNLLVAIGLAQTVPLTRLAEIMVLDRTTLARNLKPLESQGLVVVEP